MVPCSHRAAVLRGSWALQYVPATEAVWRCPCPPPDPQVNTKMAETIATLKEKADGALAQP